MSADNEVAIIQFSPGEYGVRHLISFCVQEHTPEQLQSLKQECKIFYTFEDALTCAEDIHDSLPLVEYGITRYRLSS